jgi:hypothetical protein
MILAVISSKITAILLYFSGCFFIYTLIFLLSNYPAFPINLRSPLLGIAHQLALTINSHCPLTCAYRVRRLRPTVGGGAVRYGVSFANFKLTARNPQPTIRRRKGKAKQFVAVAIRHGVGASCKSNV